SDSLVDIRHVSVNKIFRLGTYQGDQGTKSRPLIMVLASEEQKNKLLKQAKNLRTKREKGLDKVFIHQDLTPHQRMRRQKLVQEMKTRQNSGERDLIIVNWKIVTRRARQETYQRDDEMHHQDNAA